MLCCCSEAHTHSRSQSRCDFDRGLDTNPDSVKVSRRSLSRADTCDDDPDVNFNSVAPEPADVAAISAVSENEAVADLPPSAKDLESELVPADPVPTVANLPEERPDSDPDIPVEPEPEDVLRKPCLKDSDFEEFEVVIAEKVADAPLGAYYITGKDQLVISRICKGGLLDRWNEDNPRGAVKPGSVVVSINSRTTLEEMAMECKTATRLVLQVQFRSVYSVFAPINKAHTLGLFVRPGTMVISRLESMRQCTLTSWNEDCKAGYEIMPGDEIIQVNGSEGGPEDLLQAIKACDGDLCLILRRGQLLE